MELSIDYTRSSVSLGRNIYREMMSIRVNPRIIVLALPRGLKRLIVMGVDSLLAVLSVWFAYYLRLGEFLPLFERTNEHFPVYAWLLAIFISTPIFMYFGLYRIIFRYAGSAALFSITKAVGIYGLIYALIISSGLADGVPRTIGFIQPIVFLLLVSSTRMLARFWLGELYKEELKKNRLPQALIYGAGTAGRELAAALSHSHEVRVAGFIDDDQQLQGSMVSGLSVYVPDELKKTIDTKSISQIMLAMPRINRTRRNEIIHSLLGLGVTVRTLPSASDLSQGRVSVNDVRELTIDEILGRDAVEPDPELLKRDIDGKTVLVTGAGGSIGSELCRQIIAQNPKKLILFDHSEFALYQINQELSKQNNGVPIQPLLGSVTDEIRVEQILNHYHPDTVYHAAAYKHVHLVEENPFEGIVNNSFGTLTLAQCAIAAGVQKFVLISTDKAVRPTNVMGASKRLAEMVLQSLSTTKADTLFAMVRFGNVLNSSGSVVPIFREQIKSGGPVTVTHKDVTRYFMTIEEAASLVLQAGAMTVNPPAGGEAAPVYLLEMGEPVKIYDLAVKMIELSGMKPFINGSGDVEIQITGLQEGEKLFEELLISDNAQKTAHPKIYMASEMSAGDDSLWTLLTDIKQYAKDADIERLKTCISAFVAS